MNVDLIAGAGLAAVLTLVTRAKKALTWPAVLTADAMILLISWLSSVREAAFLIAMYVVVFAVDLVFHSGSGSIKKKGGTRRFSQIMANGTAGCVCILLYALLEAPAFLIGYYCSIYEVLSDSIASDVGVLSKREPRDICTGKVLPRGISGGISLLGSVSSGAACLGMGLVTGLVLELSAPQTATIIAVPYCGMLVDSIIGSLIQVKYRCSVCGALTEKQIHCGAPAVICGGRRSINNSTVNFICTVLSAVLGTVIGLFL